MKNLFKILFLFLLFALVYIYQNNIVEFILDNYIYKKNTYLLTNNEYALDYDYSYVSITDDFYAKNKQQILDIFYTYLNSGTREFYFFCEYDGCENDVSSFTNNNIFGNLNNFVSPYNTYNKLYISISPWGKVEISINKAYSNNEITAVESKIDEIIEKIITNDMTDREKIKAFHDYVINNTKYDSDYVDDNLNDMYNYSHKATGALLYSKALCGGYSHSMALFLNKLKIPNYRISSDTHIWNLVYLDNKWYHLDLTWDDPITSNKKDVLLDEYFLIETKKLKNLNTAHHDFDETIYKEAIQKY